MCNEIDLTETQELPICEAPIHALPAIEFWERTGVLGLSPPDGKCTCHAPNPDSARAAREAFNAMMGEPLRLWDHMMMEG